jgi:PadR family transcriptional regulator, regulatory protein PadR
MLKGTLDMMVLRTLVTGDAHGHTIAKAIERTWEDVLEVEQGSLYPALHRLEDRGWVSSYGGASENNRKAKFYRLAAAGKKQLVCETTARGRWPVRLAWPWVKTHWQMEVSDELAQVLSPAAVASRIAGGNRCLSG